MSADDIVTFWDRVARDWDTQIGDDGDSNRMLNSDPVLWRFAGEVLNRDVLDAGCGTGYLSRKLAKRGANVIGIDLSPNMIGIARKRAPALDFRVDSCSELATVADTSTDLVVANYVLMDTPDLDAAVASFHRVLRPGGAAVLIFSHPCFPQGEAHTDRDAVRYTWELPYFEERRQVDPPWKHFTSEFIWFHRPLSHYFKAFRTAGFDVVEFEEPHISQERYHLAGDEQRLRKLKERPYSVAFKLLKP
jgi:SAM-dependent methyltransferase